MKIQVIVDVPPGDTCHYPPEEGASRGPVCAWGLRHMAAQKRWCRIFGDVDVTSGYKCPACKAALGQEVEHG